MEIDILIKTHLSQIAQHHFLNNDARLPSTLTFLAAAIAVIW